MGPFAAIRARYPAITSLEVSLRRSGTGFEAQADVRLPQHQIIVNAAGVDAVTAARELAGRVERELERLALRDRAVAAAAQAKAA